MKATLPNGDLRIIPNCDIQIPTSNGWYEVPMRVLPEIGDSHGSNYSDTTIPGRSFPIKNYNHGENRAVPWKVTFVIAKSTDARDNLRHLRALQSATYPRESQANPYLPPPICKIRCGSLLSGTASGGYLCAILRKYSTSFPTDVAWYQDNNDPTLYLPYKFVVDLDWEIVYSSDRLPGQDKIFTDI